MTGAVAKVRNPFLSGVAFVAASLSIAALAETVRLPAEGTPALMVDLPPGWQQKPLGEYGNMDITHVDRHVGIRLSVIEGAIDKVQLSDMAAAQIKEAGFPPFAHTEPASISGRAGQAFIGSAANKKGVGLNYRIVWVKLSSTHAAMVARLAAIGATPQEEQAVDALFGSIRLIVAR